MRFSRTGGFALLELLVAIVIFGLLTVAIAKYATRYQDRQSGQRLGTEMAQLAHAVAGAVFAKSASIPVSTAPTVFSGGPGGYQWLQDVSCGGPLPAGEGLLSCRFNDLMASRFGTFYTVTTTRLLPEGPIVAEVSVGPISLNGEIRIPVAAIARNTAEANYGMLTLSGVSEGTNDFFLSYNTIIDPADSAAGTVIATVDTTAGGAGADPYLRLDGSNEMLGDLDVGDGTNDIVDANNIYWGVGNENALLNASGDGGIQLTGAGGSFIEFRRAAGTPNARIINDADGQLTIEADDILVIDARAVDLIGADSVFRAADFIDSTKNKSLNQAVTDVYISTSGSVIPQPNCMAPNVPTIYTAISAIAGIDSSSYAAGDVQLHNLSAIQSRATDNGDGTWSVGLVGFAQDIDQFTPPDVLGRILVVTKCS